MPYFDKYARRYLVGFCFRFNPRFPIAEMNERIANAGYPACLAWRGISGLRRLMNNQKGFSHQCTAYPVAG